MENLSFEEFCRQNQYDPNLSYDYCLGVSPREEYEKYLNGDDSDDEDEDMEDETDNVEDGCETLENNSTAENKKVFPNKGFHSVKDACRKCYNSNCKKAKRINNVFMILNYMRAFCSHCEKLEDCWLANSWNSNKQIEKAIPEYNKAIVQAMTDIEKNKVDEFVSKGGK